MLYSGENAWTMGAYKSMGKVYEYNIKQKKLDTREHSL